MTKQKDTLYKHHGVSNAYALAKRKTISLGQRKLFEVITKLFPNVEVFIEKRITTKPHSIFADILVPDQKIVIEYNGDFWHCNPKKYNSNYFHPKKQLLAEQIWENDKNRSEIITGLGYKLLIIWENEFKTNSSLVVEKIKEIISEK